MASPNFAIEFFAQMSGAITSLSVGNCCVDDGFGLYTLATSTARGTMRSDGIALTPNSIKGGSVQLQQFGKISNTVSGLGVGAASWVRVSTAGLLERVTPTTGDDIVGWAEADGSVHTCFGYLTAAMVNATGGGGGSPTGPAGGDLSGTYPNPVVAAIKQTVVGTAGGGNVGAPLRMTATSTADWGQLDLANGNAVTGILSAAHQAAQAMAGDVTGTTSAAVVAKVKGITITGAPTVSGQAIVSTSTTAAAWVTVPVSVGASGQVDTSDGAGGWQAATNVLAGPNFVSIGATPAAAGAIRMANNTNVSFRNAGGTADVVALAVDASANVNVGANQGSQNNLNLNSSSGGSVNIGAGAGGSVAVSSTAIKFGLGIGGLNNPLQLRRTTLTFAGSDITLSSAQAECPILQVSNTSAGNIIAPDVGGSLFIVDNSLASTPTRTIKKSGGTGCSVGASTVTTVYHNGTDYVIVSLH